jgi:hypothetical protein
MRVRIERHPDYPSEERYIIRFYEDDQEIYSEECTWLIQATGGAGKVELFSRERLHAWDNFVLKPASQPEPLKHTFTMEELADGNGLVFPQAGEYHYIDGSVISVVALPNMGYRFKGWFINGVSNTDNPAFTSLTTDTAVQSQGFERDPAYAILSITVTPTLGGVTEPFVGDYVYSINSTVQVKATAFAGYRFDHWELDGVNVGSANPISVVMDADHTLTAVFVVTPKHTLTVNSVPITGVQFQMKKVG